VSALGAFAHDDNATIEINDMAAKMIAVIFFILIPLLK
jgi:hypothetical protein